MSTFIWGKIKLRALPESFNSYQKGDILVFFDAQRRNLYKSDLKEREIYFTIACGYEKMIYPSQHGQSYLNCDAQFFSIDFIKNSKRKTDIEPYFDALRNRIRRLQNVIMELFKSPEVEQMEYFYTETGNESSIEEYEQVDWKIEEFGDNFFDEIVKNKGFAPTIRAVFQK